MEGRRAGSRTALPAGRPAIAMPACEGAPHRRAVLLAAAAFAVLGPVGAARAQPLSALPAISPLARSLRDALPGKAVLGAAGTSPKIVELVDFNAPEWRRSARDMRDLLAASPGLAYGIVQAPRFDVKSVEAARIALAVLEMAPARFDVFYMALAETEGEIDGVRAVEAARGLGLDAFKVFRAANQPEVTTSLTKAVELSSALRLLSTPAYIIGDRLLSGYADLERKRALISEIR